MIEAAPAEQEAGKFQQQFTELDLKLARFKERFNRSPTASEAELEEADWEDMESDESLASKDLA